MIHQIDLIQLVGSWKPLDLSSHQLVESAWNDWARYETFKRYIQSSVLSPFQKPLTWSIFSALALAFIQDCTYCFYYAASPAFTSAEFKINLPCDDALWKAQSSRDWYHIQSVFSAYGTGKSRLLGVSMELALATLTQPVSSPITFTTNPFSAFVLVHTILRDIFNHRVMSGRSLMSRDAISLTIQRSLHNWQIMWGSSPDGSRLDRNIHDIPFVFSAVPFYWLARFADGQKFSAMPSSNSPRIHFSDASGEDRYRIVKGWLNQINATLRSGSQMLSTTGSNPIVGYTGFTTFLHHPWKVPMFVDPFYENYEIPCLFCCIVLII